MKTKPIVSVWMRAFDKHRPRALAAFETVEYFGDELDEDAQDIVAGFAYAYQYGLIIEREYHDVITSTTGCCSSVFYDFQRFASDLIRQAPRKEGP